MASTTPYMQLILPTIGIDSGLFWEESVNANFSTIDSHNHSPGRGGIQITPNGLNINQDLPFNGNNAILLRSSRYSSQAALLTAPADLGCVYVFQNELYYRDLLGANVKITTNGNIVAVSNGINNGPASATFSGPPYVLQVTSAADTPAPITAANISIGNIGVAASNFVILQATPALAASYSLVLPPVSPSGTQLLVIDNVGNINPADTVSGLIADNIGLQMSATGANNIASKFTAMPGAQAEVIAFAMTPLGSNTIAGTMNVAGANAIAGKMDATGGNAIGSVINSAATANNITSHSTNTLLANNGAVGAKFIFGYCTPGAGAGNGYSWTSVVVGGTQIQYTVAFTTPLTNAASSLVTTANTSLAAQCVTFNFANTGFNFTALNPTIPFSFMVFG